MPPLPLPLSLRVTLRAHHYDLTTTLPLPSRGTCTELTTVSPSPALVRDASVKAHEYPSTETPSVRHQLSICNGTSVLRSTVHVTTVSPPSPALHLRLALALRLRDPRARPAGRPTLRLAQLVLRAPQSFLVLGHRRLLRGDVPLQKKSARRPM